MKWFSVLPIVALAFLANACEKHPVADAPEEGTTAFGEHSKAAEEKSEAKPAVEAPASKEAAPAATPEGKAPKIFPETK
jgi:hypothetical protein